MHLSRYLNFFSYPGDSDYTLLYNIQNAAMALLPNEDCEALKEQHITKEYEENLRELGMLVDDMEAEQQEALNMLNEVNRQDEALNVSIILGMACNFACVYCYEGSQKDGRAMDSTTISQTVSFLQQRYVARKKKKLRLDFYGGEPLLYPETIKQIAAPLKQYVEDKGGTFHFSLVTNGSLLTRNMVEELVPVGLYAAKVTVDGPAHTHNKLRPFKSGQPSFSTILKNIQDCIGLIKIGFGGNYTKDTFQQIPELLDSVEKYNITPETVSNVQFHPVQQTGDQFANPEFTGGCASVDEPWMAEASMTAREEVLKRGFKTPKLSPSPCMVDLEDAFVINHDGKLYKCVAMIGHEAYAAGDVFQDMDDYREQYCLEHWKQEENKQCRECEYLPLCFGGCRYSVFQRTGSMENVECMRSFYDRVLEKTVQQDAEYLTGNTETT